MCHEFAIDLVGQRGRLPLRLLQWALALLVAGCTPSPAPGATGSPFDGGDSMSDAASDGSGGAGADGSSSAPGDTATVDGAAADAGLGDAGLGDAALGDTGKADAASGAEDAIAPAEVAASFLDMGKFAQCSKSKCLFQEMSCMGKKPCAATTSCIATCATAQCVAECGKVAATSLESKDYFACIVASGCLPGVPASCGNGVCESGETNATCAADCELTAKCGNNACEPGETPTGCPGDCTWTSAGCGDGTCSAGENCPADCDKLYGAATACFAQGCAVDFAECTNTPKCLEWYNCIANSQCNAAAEKQCSQSLGTSFEGIFVKVGLCAALANCPQPCP